MFSPILAITGFFAALSGQALIGIALLTLAIVGMVALVLNDQYQGREQDEEMKRKLGWKKRGKEGPGGKA